MKLFRDNLSSRSTDINRISTAHSALASKNDWKLGQFLASHLPKKERKSRNQSIDEAIAPYNISGCRGSVTDDTPYSHCVPHRRRCGETSVLIFPRFYEDLGRPHEP